MEQTFEDGKYYASGKKVLYYFSVRKILPVVIVFIILSIGLDILNSFLKTNGINNISQFFVIALGIISCLIAFLIAWVKYKNVQFMFDEFSFHIKKGFLSKSEISIPYRQIQYINHSQSLNDKMLGVMKIIIETAGDDDSRDSLKNEGVLPILETNIALSIEKELLKRSNINQNS